MAHDRRRIVHFAVTEHPTAEWTAQQIREAFPWDSAPRYVLRDRDGIYGRVFTEEIATFGIEQVLSAPRSPWQRAYAERVIGTIRGECLHHVLVFGPDSLHRHLRAFVVAIPQVGGLLHRYERRRLIPPIVCCAHADSDDEARVRSRPFTDCFYH